MAIWQYKFSMIPQNTLLGNFNSYPSILQPNDIENFSSWSGCSISEESIKSISKTLKETHSWSDDIKQYGSLEGTCIELIYEKNKLVEISIRFDLRNITLEILLRIIDFIKENDALILTQEGILLKPELEGFVKEIKKSDAYSFIKNPQEFLSSLVD